MKLLRENEPNLAILADRINLETPSGIASDSSSNSSSSSSSSSSDSSHSDDEDSGQESISPRKKKRRRKSDYDNALNRKSARTVSIFHKTLFQWFLKIQFPAAKQIKNDKILAGYLKCDLIEILI